ncbi:MAG: PepSY-like domain-containing protein [Ferruginibacter sp.]
MKKFLLLAITIYFFTGAVFAQKIAESKVPAAVKAAFQKNYPGIEGKWEKEAGNYEVNFKQNNKSMSLLLTPKGVINETEESINIAALPSRSLAYISKHRVGKKIKDAAKITLANGSINYEAEVSGKDMIFDEKGQFLREVED